MSDTNVLIEVNNVSKKFSRTIRKSMWYGLIDMIKAMVGISRNGSRLRKDEFWAVKQVNFSLRRGECLGLIGRNGAGKSTLLKMLNGLITPDTGEIIIRGKVGALIELGAGFNPILSGRENIYVNGQLLGLTKKEIDERLESIIEFSEIREFIDSPVQNYSSGMKVRLGFAVAAQMQPDVLIIDEVLAVGDLGFVLKCFSSIDVLLPDTAVIFVSHSMPQVSRICNSIMMLEKGSVIFHSNDIAKGIDVYYSKFARKENSNVMFERDGTQLLEVGFATGVGAYSKDCTVQRLDDLRILFRLRVRNIFTPYITVTFFDKEQRPVGICMTPEPVQARQLIREDGDSSEYRSELVIPRINLSKGIYSISVSASEGFRDKPLLRVQSAGTFQVSSEHDVWQAIEFESKWT